MVGGLGTKMSIVRVQPCFYTHNTQCSMFLPTVVVVGGLSEYCVQALSAAHRGHNADVQITRSTVVITARWHLTGLCNSYKKKNCWMGFTRYTVIVITT